MSGAREPGRRRRRRRLWIWIAAAAWLAVSAHASTLDDARLEAASRDAENWLSHGRTPDEQRFSPLAQVDTRTIGRLGLAWSFEFPERRGVEATPLVVDGSTAAVTPMCPCRTFT